MAVFGWEWNLVECTWTGLDTNQKICWEISLIFPDLSPQEKGGEKEHKQPDDGNLNMELKEFSAPGGAGDNLESQPSDPLLPCEVSDEEGKEDQEKNGNKLESVVTLSTDG